MLRGPMKIPIGIGPIGLATGRSTTITVTNFGISLTTTATRTAFHMSKIEELRAKASELHVQAQKTDDHDQRFEIALKALELEAEAETLEYGSSGSTAPSSEVSALSPSEGNPFLLPLCNACGYLNLSRIVPGGNMPSARLYRCSRCDAEQQVPSNDGTL
jgi:hypothetical protein